MIILNEEAILRRILNCAKTFCDELIIVDTGSSDKSKEIAREYTDNIYDFVWVNDFSKARNYSFSKAKCDYIMWLDADDFITNENCDKLKKLKLQLNNFDTILLPYVLGKNKSRMIYYRERIVKNDGTHLWLDPIHEVMQITGKIGKFDIEIEHRKEKANNPKRNLKVYQKLKKDGMIFNARQQFYYASEYYYNNLFHKAIAEYKVFFQMPNKYIENELQGYLNIARCYLNLSKIISNSSTAQNRLRDFACLYLLKAIELDPRCEHLCELGIVLMEKEKFKSAILCFDTCLKLDIKSDFAFNEKDKHDLIPYINLGFCYYRLNNIKKAINYNNLALKLAPDNEIALNNQKYFK